MSGACVYRFFNSDGDLLYVGQCGDLGRRTQLHQSMTPWFTQVTSIRVEHVASRIDALAAEAAAIIAEEPRYNVHLRRTYNLAADTSTGRPVGVYLDSDVMRQALRDLRMTRVALGSLVGLSQAHLSNVINGKYRVSFEAAQRIASALSVHPWWSLARSLPQPSSEVAA